MYKTVSLVTDGAGYLQARAFVIRNLPQEHVHVSVAIIRRAVWKLTMQQP